MTPNQSILLNDPQQIAQTVARLLAPKWSSNPSGSAIGEIFEWSLFSDDWKQDLDNLLQEVLRWSPQLPDAALVQWLKSTYDNATSLPSWQPLFNRTKEILVMRYGMLQADRLLDGLNSPKRDIMNKTTGNLPTL